MRVRVKTQESPSNTLESGVSLRVPHKIKEFSPYLSSEKGPKILETKLVKIPKWGKNSQ